MPLPSSAQPRRPAGTPTGGQFASLTRPEARGIHLVEDVAPTTPAERARQALLEIEELGAESAEQYSAIGRVAAGLPAAARSIVADGLERGSALHNDPSRAFVDPLAELAIARAVRSAGFEHGRIEDLVSGLAAQVMQTTIERAARFHVRRALNLEDVGDTTWVCPTDPRHGTQGGVCVDCGARRVANRAAADQVPIEAMMEASGEDAGDVRSHGRAVTAHAAVPASALPSKQERQLREIVSELYRLQNEADASNEHAAGAFDRAAEMLDAAITEAFSGEAGMRQTGSATPACVRIDPTSIAWTTCGDLDSPGGEEAQLLGTMTVGQTPFHVLALQVEDTDDDQRALQRDDDLVDAMRALGDDVPYETVEIDGRPYVLLISPHGR